MRATYIFHLDRFEGLLALHFGIFRRIKSRFPLLGLTMPPGKGEIKAAPWAEQNQTTYCHLSAFKAGHV